MSEAGSAEGNKADRVSRRILCFATAFIFFRSGEGTYDFEESSSSSSAEVHDLDSSADEISNAAENIDGAARARGVLEEDAVCVSDELSSNSWKATLMLATALPRARLLFPATFFGAILFLFFCEHRSVRQSDRCTKEVTTFKDAELCQF